MPEEVQDEQAVDFRAWEPSPEDPNNEKLPEELISCLKELLEEFEREDSWVRKQQIKIWKKNEEFWHGVQFIFWSESKQDWITPSETRWFPQEEGREEAEGPFYDYVINIYKAHGESIIAALSVDVPGVRFPPDDADSDEDQTTSKTYSKIADLIQRHNRAKMILMRALHILFNQGLIAGYHTTKSDPAFGHHKIPRYTEKISSVCPKCGPIQAQGGDDVNPEPSQTAPLENCPMCDSAMEERSEQVVDGYDEPPKSRVIIDLFGPLHVKIPFFVRFQSEFGYLLCSLDQSRALLKSIYPHITEKLDTDQGEAGQYERLARTPSSFAQYSRIEENKHMMTLRRLWIRPWEFKRLGETKKEEREKLEALFPDGCYVAFAGTTYAESRSESMDERWTIGKSGLSTYIHSDPLGQPLVPVQEMRNVLRNLTLDTIEHGIPSTFANPKCLDFDTYSRHEAAPGFIYPAEPPAGTKMDEHFYQERTATLSEEVNNLGKELDQDAQFVVGSFPSIYGGPSEGSSRTFGEYELSRKMALQRLSIAWTMVSFWWATLMERCVKLYVKTFVEDEKFVHQENGNYVNVWIRKEQMSGKVGEVETESSEAFPMTTPQKQALMLQLFQLNNDFINAALFDQENRRLMTSVMSLPDLKIPGEDQRIKQMREIQVLVQEQSDGQNPSVVPEPEVDDDQIHIVTAKNWLVSEIGMDAKRTNPAGYENVKAHLRAHEMNLQQKAQQPSEETGAEESPATVE